MSLLRRRPHSYASSRRLGAYPPMYAQGKAPGTIRTKRILIAVGTMLIVVLLGGGASVLLLLRSANKTQPNTSQAPSPQQLPNEKIPPPKPPQKDTAAMSARISELIAANPDLNIGVSCIDLVYGTSTDYGVQVNYVAASITKLLAASFYLQQVQQNAATLDEIIGGKPAAEQLRLMIVDSDQPAWSALKARVGAESLETYAHHIGMSSYTLADNTVNPKDVAMFLQKLYNRTLLDDTRTNIVLAYMEQAGERQYIVDAIPQGTKVYHKAGYLDNRVLDAAIIDNGSYPYILVIFTKSQGDYDFVRGSQLFNAITTATTLTFLGPQSATPSDG